MKPRALVLRSPGTNCDYETGFALRRAGFESDAVHVNALIRGERSLEEFDLLVLPGGFSYGDYISSGKILANKLSHRLKGAIPGFVDSGGVVLGICNGFQTLVRSGLLPGFGGDYSKQLATLALNDSGHFQDQWVTMQNVSRGKCPLVKGVKSIYTPINHGEGRFVPRDKNVLDRLYDEDQVVFKYIDNPNGSVDGIAGICDSTGRILGFMPHPEKNVLSINDPRSTRVDLPPDGEGFAFFRALFSFVKKKR